MKIKRDDSCKNALGQWRILSTGGMLIIANDFFSLPFKLLVTNQPLELMDLMHSSG